MEPRLQLAQDKALARLIRAFKSRQPDTVNAYLKALGTLHTLSWLNVLLIFWQEPGASNVNRPSAWSKLSRQVVKGSKRILISNVQALEKRYVYDVGDTKGEQVVDTPWIHGDADCYLILIQHHIGQLGIVLNYPGSATNLSTRNEVTIKKGMPAATEFPVLCKELARQLQTREGRKTTRHLQDLELEATIFILTSTLRLKNCSVTTDFIGLYQEGPEQLAESLNFIQRTSSQLIEVCLCQFHMGGAQ